MLARGADGDGQSAPIEPFGAAEPSGQSGHARLADHLIQARKALPALDLPAADRVEPTRRPPFVTAVSRHDRSEAMRRLKPFLDALALRHKGD
jgi:hypothetical protein